MNFDLLLGRAQKYINVEETQATRKEVVEPTLMSARSEHKAPPHPFDTRSHSNPISLSWLEQMDELFKW